MTGLGLNIHVRPKRLRPVSLKSIKRLLLLGLTLVGLYVTFLGISANHKTSNHKTQRTNHQARLDVVGGLGIALGLFASERSWDYRGLLEEISALGVSQVMIVIPLHQASIFSNTPSLGVGLDRIRTTIRQAQSLSLQVSLMPIIKLQKRQINEWRGKLAPSKEEIWWSNYGVELKRLATLATRQGIQRLVIGAELCSLEHQYERWVDLITDLRGRFKGVLSYSANWDHYRKIKYWSLLDEIAVTAYFPISERSKLESLWHRYIDELEQFAGIHQRPLLITEYGYPALDSAMKQPWNETSGAAFNPKLQAELITGATQTILERISAVHDQPKTHKGILKGAFLWNWFGFGAQIDHGFTLRGREGEVTLKLLLTSLKETR